MSDENPVLKDIDVAGKTTSTESPLLSILSGLNGAASAANSGPQAAPSHESLDLSSILPSSHPTSGDSGTSNSITSIPLDSDIDQLMKSLDSTVDTSKVSNDDIDKLLGSIGVSIPNNLSIPSVSSAAPGSDPLAALSRDLGIDLTSSSPLTATQPGTTPLVSLPVPNMPALASSSTSTPAQSAISSGSVQQAGAQSNNQSQPATASISASVPISPGLP
ncbi:hypothetical protein GGI12_002707, partial [Dipsacomyces acuminosporus]